MSDEFLYLTLYKKTCASHVIKCMIVFSDLLYIFVLPATETADFPSLIICHNVSYRRKSFSLPYKGKCFLVLYRTQENSLLNRNKLVSTSLQDTVVNQKVSFFIPVPLIGFAGKIASQIL